MLYVVFGNDAVGVRTKAHELITRLSEGRGVLSVTGETYSHGMLSDLAGSVSLFSQEDVVILDSPSENPAMFEEVTDNAELIGESENTFVLIEGGLLSPEKKKLEKHAKDMIEVKRPESERFNAFALADAFVRRDKRSLWLLLVRAREEGLSNEEIIGTLYWQVKMLRLAERTKSAEEAGQKPFVYQKAKRALASFKTGELDVISRDLLSIYHDGHLGKRDIDLALEHWVLTL